MKILFVNPRYYEENFRYKVNKLCPPLGMATLANVLQQQQHQVLLYDFEALKVPIEEYASKIQEFNADIIGVFGTSPISQYIKKTIDALIEISPVSTIIVGGPHATLFPEELFKHNLKIDYAFRGEAEESILQFVNQIQKYNTIIEPEKIEGLVFKKDNGELYIDKRIPKIQDLDAIPMPAYNLLLMSAYFEAGSSDKTITMMTSRGCPQHCIYCAAPVLYGHKYRSRSPKSVVAEMKYLRDTYAIDHIVFYDANFNSDKKRVKQICQLLIDDPIQLTWRARIRADNVDEEMVMLMKASGCVELSLGVETGSDKMLKVLKKHETVEEIRQAFKLIKKHNIWCSGYFMFGIPGETVEDAKRTIQFAIELDPDWALFSSATPLPGTEFFNMYQQNIIDTDLNNFKFNFDNPVVSYENFSSQQISHYINYAYESFYLRADWLINRLKKTTSISQVNNIINSYQFYRQKNDSYKSTSDKVDNKVDKVAMTMNNKEKMLVE